MFDSRNGGFLPVLRAGSSVDDVTSYQKKAVPAVDSQTNTATSTTRRKKRAAQLLWDLSVHRKLTLMTTAPSFVVLFLVLLTLLAYDLITLHRNRLEELTVLADIIGNGSSAVLSSGDQASAQRILASLSAQPNVLVAQLFSENGTLLAGYSRVDEEPVPPPPNLADEPYRLTFGSLGQWRRIELDGQIMGSVYLKGDTRDIYARLRNHAALVAVGWIVASLLVLRPLSWLKRMITDPILSLVDVVMAVSRRKDYTVRAAKAANDEVGLLTDGFNDILTNIQQREQKLVHEALHDSLTGLPNRVFFMEQLARVVDFSRRRKRHAFCLLYLDIDRFKVINDSLGHVLGDRLLVELSRRFKDSVRPMDTVARLGGDEFGVLLDRVADITDGIHCAERLLGQLTAPFYLEGHQVFVSASIGIVDGEQGGERAEDLLRDGDIAMYRAKQRGKGCYTIFSPDMHTRAVALLQLENDLRRALERDELVLHYQPIVALRSGRIAGFEALVRWRHPDRGLIPPSEFIRVAEDTGLITLLGRWVLFEACRQLGEWGRELPGGTALSININVSAVQFSQPHLVDQLEEALTLTDPADQHLHLEVTENAIMDNPEACAAIMMLLRDMGVKLAIDDFGTGYSSLSHLQHFPVDTLKVDRTFVGGMTAHVGELEIVRTIISLAHNLGMKVVAEGVETEEQAARLKELQCDYGQGNWFSAPLAAGDAEQFLSQPVATGDTIDSP